MDSSLFVLSFFKKLFNFSDGKLFIPNPSNLVMIFETRAFLKAKLPFLDMFPLYFLALAMCLQEALGEKDSSLKALFEA